MHEADSCRTVFRRTGLPAFYRLALPDVPAVTLPAPAARRAAPSRPVPCRRAGTLSAASLPTGAFAVNRGSSSARRIGLPRNATITSPGGMPAQAADPFGTTSAISAPSRRGRPSLAASSGVTARGPPRVRRA